MDDFIINGELYIKKNPTTKVQIIETENAIADMIDINGNRIEDFDFNNPKHLEMIPPYLMWVLENLGVIKKIEIKDYRDNYGFYQLFMSDNTVNFVNKRLKQTYRYQSITEGRKEFISLYEFLKKALYIGRYLEPTEEPMLKFELLYEQIGNYIVRDCLNNKFLVFAKDHPFLEKYKIGDILPYYYEKQELLNAIANQEILSKDNYGRK